MKHLAVVLLIMFSLSEAFAGFGGSRGGGGFSGGSRSYSSGSSFGGSRSYSAPSRSYSSSGSSFGGSRSTPGAPIVRPSNPAPSAPVRIYTRTVQPSVVHRETVVHHNDGPGFFTGMMMGSMMNRPTTVVTAPVATVPVAPAAPIVTDGGVVAAAPQAGVIVERSSGWAWFWFFVVLGLSGFVIYLMFFKEKEKRRW